MILSLRARVIFLFSLLLGFELSAQDGSNSYQLLSLPSSAHIAALGGTNLSIYTTNVADAAANPALLSGDMAGELSLNYMHYLKNVNVGNAYYGFRIKDRGALSVGFRFADFGKFTASEPDGTITGTFGAKDMLLATTYSHDITSLLRGGITLNVLYSAYERYSALALGVDLGVNYYFSEIDASLSLVLRNMGGQLVRLDERHAPLPFDVQVGYSQRFKHAPLRFSVTAHQLTRWNMPYYQIDDDGSTVLKNDVASNIFRHLIFGLDVLPTENIYIALGYNYKMRTDMQVADRNFFSGFSIGAGITISRFSVGASFAQHHISGSSLMISISTDLTGLKL